MTRKRVILIGFLMLLLGVGVVVWWGQSNRRGAELYYSGTIEATSSNLAFQVGGRVQEILTDEGQSVDAGAVLAVLDRREYVALRDQARANLQRARQNLLQLGTVLEVNRNVLPAEVDRAAAAVKALQAQLAEAESGYRTQEVERARLAADAARVTLENACKDKDRYDELFRKGVVAEKSRDGFQKGVAYGGKDGLARIRQKQEGKDEYLDGEAERIEYNTNNEVAEFFHRAWVRSGQDQVKGDYIWYDGISEKYLVTAGKNGDPKGSPARVRAIIQPRNKTESPADSGPKLDLKGSASLPAKSAAN